MKKIVLTLSLIVGLLGGLLFSNVAVKPTLAIGEFRTVTRYVHIVYSCYNTYQITYGLGNVYLGTKYIGVTCF